MSGERGGLSFNYSSFHQSSGNDSTKQYQSVQPFGVKHLVRNIETRDFVCNANTKEFQLTSDFCQEEKG